jgi:hypothetical protein
VLALQGPLAEAAGLDQFGQLDDGVELVPAQVRDVEKVTASKSGADRCAQLDTSLS